MQHWLEDSIITQQQAHGLHLSESKLHPRLWLFDFPILYQIKQTSMTDMAYGTERVIWRT